MKNYITFLLFISIAFVSGCTTTMTTIIDVSEIPETIEKTNSDNVYKLTLQKMKGGMTERAIRREAMSKIDEFSEEKDRSFQILSEEANKAPFSFSNPPKIIVYFELVDNVHE